MIQQTPQQRKAIEAYDNANAERTRRTTAVSTGDARQFFSEPSSGGSHDRAARSADGFNSTAEARSGLPTTDANCFSRTAERDISQSRSVLRSDSTSVHADRSGDAPRNADGYHANALPNLPKLSPSQQEDRAILWTLAFGLVLVGILALSAYFIYQVHADANTERISDYAR